MNTIDGPGNDRKELYRKSVNQVLAGFQIVEEMLKTYIERHFDLTRSLINGRLHFEFCRQDYQEAALGRRIQVFSKLCANHQLVSDLRAAVEGRDHVAPRALLKLYESAISPEEYVQISHELLSDMDKNTELMTRIVLEMEKLGE
jgi:hypothetical protein